MRRSGRVIGMAVAGLLAAALLAPAAAAQPTPPPNPSDDELQRSQQGVSRQADEVARLTTQLADLDSRTDDVQAALAAQRESAEAALVDLQSARSAAALAKEQAASARVETDAATVAIDHARARLDAFVTATYQQGMDTGPLGLLTGATSPEDLIARAEMNDLIARSQLAAQDGLERARVDKANADAAARAAVEEAQRREGAAQSAKVTADAAVAVADQAAREHTAELSELASERAGVQRALDAAASSDAGLRQQRAAFTEWQKRMAAEQAARERAEREAAAKRVSASGSATVGRGSGSVQRVIDRAMSQLGVQYVWGGGTGRGPTTGIPDGLGSPLNRVGFDCSGLMLYAFGGAGVSLPRVSRNQFDAGQKVPISDLRPGDMVFYKNGAAPIHHVAMFIGGGKMIEAPYTGASVRVTPLRTKGLLPQATRVL